MTVKQLLATAKSYKFKIRSMSDLAQFESDLVSYGVIGIDAEDLPYELFIMNQMNQNLVLSLNQVNIRNEQIDSIFKGVQQLVGRLPNPPSKFTTKRASEKAEVNEQLFRNLCVD